MLLHLLALPSLVLITSAANCDVEPTRIPIQDTKILEDVEDSYMIGMRATFGSPPQSILMLPWPDLNNTWVYDYQAYCDETILWNDLICQIRRGNYFYENASSTWSKASSLVDAGGASQETENTGAELGIADLLTTSLGGTETMSLGGTNLTSWPVGIPRMNWDHGYTTLHALGLGSNSTFLQALVDTGQIASRVWSIFWGRMWVDDRIDGSVIFGGYDSELVLGANYTQSLDYSESTGCWTGMKVTITDIVLNIRDGSKVSIFPTNYALPTCIVPQRQLLLEAPSSIVANFEEETGMSSIGTSFGLHWSAVQYLAESAYDGDMTISLSTGLSVTVQNDQFLTPFVSVERNGSRIYNETIRELLINPTYNPSTLGRYFLTAAYLMVNHDSNTFTMWQGNPSTSSNLVTVLSEKAAESCDDVSGVIQPSVTAGVTPSASATGSQESSSSGPSNGISTGAIAGAVIGGVALLAGMAVAAIFLMRKRRRRQDQVRYEVAADNSGPDGHAFKTQKPEIENANGTLGMNMMYSHEMDSTRPPSELPPNTGQFWSEDTRHNSAFHGNSHVAHEMDGRIYTFR